MRRIRQRHHDESLGCAAGVTRHPGRVRTPACEERRSRPRRAGAVVACGYLEAVAGVDRRRVHAEPRARLDRCSGVFLGNCAWAHPSARMSLEALKATVADRYRIEEELGAGGMATVYRAHDLKHDRKVALKILRPDLGAVAGRRSIPVGDPHLRGARSPAHPHAHRLRRVRRPALLRAAVRARRIAARATGSGKAARDRGIHCHHATGRLSPRLCAPEGPGASRHQA